MRPVFQTRLSRGDCGNCFEACVASVLEVPLHVVPDFGAMLLERRPDWPQIVAACDAADEPLPWPDGLEAEHDSRMRSWLAALGLALVEFDVGGDGDRYTEAEWLDVVEAWGYTWIASTQVHPRWRHATVWHGNQFAHQPSPGWTLDPDTLGPLREASYFTTVDPARCARELPRLQISAAS